MRYTLTAHPATGDTHAVEHLHVELRHDAGGISLRYVLQGKLDALILPPPAPPCFADGLWQHTCFELFLAQAGSAAYREYNFSPSGQWAGYDFCDYRARSDTTMPPAPAIQLQTGAQMLTLTAHLPGSALPPMPEIELALSAVIETRRGLSYWALAHPAQRPDFHHRQGFIGTLPRKP